MERARAPVFVAPRSVIGVIDRVRRVSLRHDMRRVLDDLCRARHQDERDQ